MNDERMDHPPLPATGAGEPRESVGTQLARRREELGWSVETVASRLNLAPRQVDAIEADNLAALPGLASTRGFVRAYAKLLRIDAAPLVAALSQEASPLEASIPLRRPLPATPFSPVRLAPMHGKRSSKRLWGLLALVVIVLAAIAAWQAGLFGGAGEGMNLSIPRGLSASAPASAPASTSASTPASSTQGMSSTPLPAPVLPAQPAPGAPQATQPGAAAPAATTPAAPATSANPAAPPAPASAAPAAPSAAVHGETAAGAKASLVTSPAAAPGASSTSAAPAPTAVAPAQPAPAQSGETRSLVLNAKESSWVEVRANNKVLLSRTLSAGSSEKIDLPGPAVLVVGNVRGVQAQIGGQPLSLKSQARNNVARIELK